MRMQHARTSPRQAADVSPTLARVTAVTWRLLVLAVAVVALVTLVTKVWVIFLAITVAILLSSVFVPAARWLERQAVPRTLASLAPVLALVAAVAGAAAFAGPQITDEFGEIGTLGTEALDRVEGWLTDGPLYLSDGQVEDVANELRSAIGGQSERIATGIVGGASLALELVGAVVLALVLAFFFTKDGERLFGGLMSFLTEESARTVQEGAHRSWTALRGFLLGSTVDGIAEAVLKALLLLVLGVPLVLPLALITFLGGFLPFIGAILAGLISAAVALAAVGPGTALLVIIGSIVIQNVEGYVLQPLIMGHAVRVHPAVILIVVTTMGLLWGILGAFLAVPAVTVARALVAFWRERQEERRQFEAEPVAAVAARPS